MRKPTTILQTRKLMTIRWRKPMTIRWMKRTTIGWTTKRHSKILTKTKTTMMHWRIKMS
jgi:hypothetical protein